MLYKIPIKPDNAVLVFFPVYTDQALVCQTGNLHDIPENYEWWNRIEKSICYLSKKELPKFQELEFCIIDDYISVLDIENLDPIPRDKLNKNQKANLAKTIKFLEK